MDNDPSRVWKSNLSMTLGKGVRIGGSSAEEKMYFHKKDKSTIVYV